MQAVAAAQQPKTAWAGAGPGLAWVEGGEPAQVVEEGGDGVGGGEDGQPGVATVEGGAEDLQFAEEDGGGRGADQAEQADDEGRRETGRRWARPR